VRQWRVLGLCLVVAGSLAAAAGCGLTSKLSGSLNSNKPPETVVFVSGDVDTVNHIVHLYWFGTDSDGEVSGFEWKLLNPQAPLDTAWKFTTLTDSVFIVRTDTGYADTRFVVRALDNAGLRDPEPAVQRFEFSNKAPIVRLTQKPNFTDTTFASVSVVWSAVDLDGDMSKLLYRVWLDGNEATPEITTGNALTMPTSRFGGPSMQTGRRRLHVQAIDDGGRAGNIDTVSWIVRRAVTGSRARLLIVDDVPSSAVTLNDRYDSLWTNSATRVGLPGSEIGILRLDKTQPFKTAMDVQQTFQLFESVVWYRGAFATTSNVLAMGEPGVAAYVATGGKFFVEGMYLFGAGRSRGSLSEDFVTGPLRSKLVRQYSTTVLDSVVGFGNINPSLFTSRVDVGGAIGRDQIRLAGIFQVIMPDDGGGGGLRRFASHDSNEVILWAEPNTLSPLNVQREPVGLTVPQPGGGLVVAVATPIFVTPGNNAAVAAFVTNLLRHFGLDRP
jgi:hypothetical protein